MEASKFFLERHCEDDRKIPILDDDTPISIFDLFMLIIGSIVAQLLAIWSGAIENSSLLFMALTAILQSVGPITIFYFIYRYFGHQKFSTLFHKITLPDLSFGILMTVLGSLYAIIMSSVLSDVSVANKAGAGLSHGMLGLVDVIVSAANDLFLLFTEELMAIIPFIAVATLAYKYFKVSRSNSILLGLVFSILIFGTMHFYTDSWHLAQMYIIVGASRIFDTGMYIRTKNILISFMFHWIFDFVIMLIILLS